MTTLTLRAVGTSVGVILPKEVLQRMNLAKGDKVFLVETANGIELTPYDPEFAATMEAHKRTKKKYRNTLRELSNR